MGSGQLTGPISADAALLVSRTARPNQATCIPEVLMLPAAANKTQPLSIRRILFNFKDANV